MVKRVLKKSHPLFNICSTLKKTFQSICNSLNIFKRTICYPRDLILHIANNLLIFKNKITCILTKSIFSMSRKRIGQIVSFCWKVFRNSFARWFSVVSCLKLDENFTIDWILAFCIDSGVLTIAWRIHESACLANSRMCDRNDCGRSLKSCYHLYFNIYAEVTCLRTSGISKSARFL